MEGTQAEQLKRVLVVDDDSDALYALVQLLELNGFEVTSATNGNEAISKAQQFLPELIILDVMMSPGPSGFEVTKTLKQDPVLRYSPVLLVTAQDALEDLVRGFENGADDYIKKPFRKEELLARIQAVLRTRALYKELERSEHTNRLLNSKLAERSSYKNMVGQSPAIQLVYDLIEKVSEAAVPVLITGESGTGKELVASALHYASPRKGQPLVVANCSAFNENLLESELFGHVKGAFTGAVRDKEGLFETADSGTFFLDELGEMSSALQVKLLRVLQDGTFTPVGSTKTKKVDVRIVAATNRDLLKMVQQGQFREDLYYRLSVVQITLPALRDRCGDIPLLINHFLVQYNSLGKKKKKIDESAKQLLVGYNWPGNIRQLQNEIQRLILLSGEAEIITSEHVSPYIRETVKWSGTGVLSNYVGSLKEATTKLERDMIAAALERTDGNKSEAARELGISRSNLIAKVQEFGLEAGE